MRTARKRTAAAVLLTAALALTGCGAGSGGSASDGRADAAAKPAEAGREGAAEGSAGPGAAGKPAAKVPEQKHVVRTAELSVEVKDAARALTDARRAAVDAGGRVENESTQRVDGTSLTSQIVLRVPQERYDSVLAALSGAGKLLDRRADAKDVTDQVVDVDSRIATQRASVARVRALMNRAEQLSDVVTLESELSRRQADLEALLAQQASLKDRTSLATITLHLSEAEKAVPDEPVEEESRPGFGEALGGGWNALVGVAAWIGIVLSALAPWLVVALIGFLLWRRLVRPRLAARDRDRGPEVLPDSPVRNAAGAAVAPGATKAPQPREAPEK
ncbi:DUF4349 domain-containing protein [Streptomyces sp. SP18ES09]|uniref:DUF4349 domain-containing protein n=1 Tax=Streptomyces sp. SP18ES09 TaxID=3002532 RepID=UPI002E7A8D76|nr:DUF4349 domain-containing protein [Streptomyces sp. SP18ES09]MEE1819467.1 DUF4349 domain-containing protein [Streptomyces sp. SP18ES09]